MSEANEGSSDRRSNGAESDEYPAQRPRPGGGFLKRYNLGRIKICQTGLGQNYPDRMDQSMSATNIPEATAIILDATRITVTFQSVG